jgi:hypothetical protein
MSLNSAELLDQIHEFLSYDADTGEIRWIKSPAKNVYAGELAGCEKATRRDAKGAPISYRYIRINGMNIPAQRIAYALHHGAFPVGRISFVDGNPLNLKADNLVTQRALVRDGDAISQNRITYFREHRQQHALSYSESDMVRKYGITLYDYSRMLVDQEGKCAICGTSEGGTRNGKAKALAIDHCHKTGKVRQLLCEACNTGLGKFKDSPEILISAAEYLRRHLSDEKTVVE